MRGGAGRISNPTRRIDRRGGRLELAATGFGVDLAAGEKLHFVAAKFPQELCFHPRCTVPSGYDNQTAEDSLKRPLMIARLEFYLSFLGCFEKMHMALRRSKGYLLNRDIERVVKPNIAFLQQCGLTDRDILQIFLLQPNVVLQEPERVKETVVCADHLGVPRDSALFTRTLVTIYAVSPGRIASRLDFLKKALGCSEAEVGIAVRKSPNVLNFTEDRMSRSIEFLKKVVGLKGEFLVHRPSLLNYSLTRWLKPRHYVLKVLQSRGLITKDIDFYNVVCLAEKRFAKKFLDPYKEGIPGIAAAYEDQVAPQTKP